MFFIVSTKIQFGKGLIVIFFYVILCFIMAYIFKKYTNSEKNHLEVETYCVTSDKLKRELRLVFLSDLHEKCFGNEQQLLLQTIRKIRPDLVLIGGDLIVCNKKKGRTDKIGESCALLHALKREYRVFMALGNHELRLREKAERGEEDGQRNWRRLLEAMDGVTVLDRETAFLPEYGLSVSGVTLPMKYYGKLLFRRKQSLSRSDFQDCGGRFPAEGCFHLCLLHTPLYYHEAIDCGADLVLSGHYHGGTIRLPLLGGLMTPQFQFFVKECAGLHSYKAGRLVVSRGLGTHSVNLRINDRPELSVIKLQPKEAVKDG